MVKESAKHAPEQIVRKLEITRELTENGASMAKATSSLPGLLLGLLTLGLVGSFRVEAGREEGIAPRETTGVCWGLSA